VDGAYVSGHFFDTLGVPAVLGRTFTPEDDRRGCAGNAVLTHGFWQREYSVRMKSSHPSARVGSSLEN
jgi:hypothetical protein